MDNISEAQTDVESIVAAPSNRTTAITTSISQEPMFGGGEYNGDEDMNVSVIVFGVDFLDGGTFKSEDDICLMQIRFFLHIAKGLQ